MAVRPINASRFAEILEQWKKDCLQDNDQQSADVISDVILQLDDMPTLTPPNEWVSVYDRLPEPGERVLATDCGFVGEFYINKRGKWQRYNVNCSELLMALDILYWMPLPAPPGKDNNAPTKKPNEPLTCGLVDRHGMPLRAGDTVAADKFFVYAVRYGSHNVNPDNCAPAYQVGWYLEIMWAYPGFEDSVGHTEPLYDIDGTAARYPAHCADTADGLYNLKLEVCCRPPEGEEDT